MMTKTETKGRIIALMNEGTLSQDAKAMAVERMLGTLLEAEKVRWMDARPDPMASEPLVKAQLVNALGRHGLSTIAQLFGEVLEKDFPHLKLCIANSDEAVVVEMKREAAMKAIKSCVEAIEATREEMRSEVLQDGMTFAAMTIAMMYDKVQDAEEQ